MNKNFLEHYMKTKPETLEQRYLFLMDDQELAFAVIAAGYYAVALLPERDGYYDLESFITYMAEIACTGTYQTDYCYVPACTMKKTNDLEMAKANGVNVYHYLTYLLEKLPNDKMSDEELELLAPWNENVKVEIKRRASDQNQSYLSVYSATLLMLFSEIICRICSFATAIKILLFDKNCHI